MIFFMIIMVWRTYNVNKSLSNGWKLTEPWLVWSDINKKLSVLFSHFTLNVTPTSSSSPHRVTEEEVVEKWITADLVHLDDPKEQTSTQT